MNMEKVKELKARAERASRIASDIEKVTEAKKFDDIDWLLRDEALRLAKAGLLSRLERELNELLGENKPAVVPTPIIPFEPARKSDPWIMPTPPFEITSGGQKIYCADHPSDLQVRMQDGANQ